jgi:cell division protein ZipA
MDLTIRDWMVVIGVILIVAVGLDAWRRVRSDRYSRVKVKLVEDGEEGDQQNHRDADLAWLKELPNGGARVVERRDLINAAAEDAARKERESAATAATAEAKGKTTSRRKTPEPEPSARTDPDDDGLISGISTADDGEPATLDWLEDIGADDDAPAPAAKPPAGKLPRDVDPEVFMLNVVARGRDGFRGEDILHILLACDLRFGDMSFFHRHEFEAGRGAIQFSVANMMQPGVFDIDNMADFNTPGLVFFLTLPGPEDMMKAFDYMLETAQAVARNLDGDVLDESRSALTRQSLEHCRQQIRDLERRMLARTR